VNAWCDGGFQPLAGQGQRLRRVVLDRHECQSCVLVAFGGRLPDGREGPSYFPRK
jgi:hypothetical protein